MICPGFKLLYALFNLADEGFRRLEGWYIVLWDHDGRVLGYDASGLLCALLHYEAPETSQVNVISF